LTHFEAAEFGEQRTIRNSEAPSAASIAAPIDDPAASSSRSLKIGCSVRPSATPFGAR
jgi:hypothetical protein